jgi:hypothetical protein
VLILQYIQKIQIKRRDATVKIVELAFTIAKEIASYTKYISLQDMSFLIVKR